MKKLLLLLIVMALGLSAQADMMRMQSSTLRQTKNNKVTNTVLTPSQAEALHAQQAPKRGDVITTRPEGEMRTYLRSAGQGIFINNGDLGLDLQSGKMDIVFAEDNVVYLKNIMCNSGLSFGANWVRGNLSDDGTTITVPLGQLIYWEDYYGAGVELCMGETTLTEVDGQPSISFAADEDVTEAVYVIDGDRITLQNTVGSSETGQDMGRWNAYGLATRWTDDGSFGGFLEWGTELTLTETTVIPTVIYDQPEGELVTYNRSGFSMFSGYFGVQSSSFTDKMNLVYGTDGKVYIQNPLWWNRSYNTWVWGDFDPETGIITVPIGQYLSYSEDVEYGVQLLWGSSIIYQNEQGAYIFEYTIDDVDAIQYKIDGDKLYLLGCQGDPYGEFPSYYNATGLMGHFSNGYNFTCLEYVAPGQAYGTLLNLSPAVPANPYNLTWEDRGTTNGNTHFMFALPTYDVDGNILEQEFISYSIFVDDDQIYTFDADDYGNIDQDVTEIPYSLWSSYWNFTPTQVDFYGTNHSDDPIFEHRIGIQVYYTVGGVKNASEIVYLNAGDLEPAVPANPNATAWYDYSQYGSRYGTFYFDLPKTDVDGNYIDQYYLSYSIFTDNDQIYTFKASDFPNELTEDVTEITSSVFYNSWTLSTYGVDLYFDEPLFSHQVGIQVYYTIDGVKNESDIVYFEVYPDTGVDEQMAGKQVASVRYFNLAGQEMAQPSGLTIQVTTFTDGTRTATKVIK